MKSEGQASKETSNPASAQKIEQVSPGEVESFAGVLGALRGAVLHRRDVLSRVWDAFDLRVVSLAPPPSGFEMPGFILFVCLRAVARNSAEEPCDAFRGPGTRSE